MLAAPRQHRGHQADEGRRHRRLKVTEKMLNYFIQKAHNRKMLVHPRMSSVCLLKLPR